VSAVVAFVMNSLAPFITHPPSHLAAVESMRVMSLPCSGSVKAAAAIFSPFASGGMYLHFCSSLPCLSRTSGIIRLPRDSATPMPGSTRHSSSTTMQSSSTPNPCPQYCSGMRMLVKPSCAAFL